MCDISEKTKKKEVAVYKVAMKYKKSYYSCFSCKKLSKGEVSPLTEKESQKGKEFGADAASTYLPDAHPDWSWNEHMVGRVSGFAQKDDARLLRDDMNDDKYRNVECVVLRVVLGGSIMRGTAKNIFKAIPANHTTYAGTEILSMEEITP